MPNAEQKRSRLWPGRAPLAEGDGPIDIPTLTPFLPNEKSRTGSAIVVCPGGGYQKLAAHEKEPIARWLNTLGIAAFVLEYRVAPNRHPAPLMDVRRAIRTVRGGANPWAVDPNRVGVLGFSAGGHLAATVSTHFDDGEHIEVDAIDRLSCRPDLAVLVYPLITMLGPFAHQGSVENLTGNGKDGSVALLEDLSAERRVTSSTPPTFLFHTVHDPVAPVEHSLMYAQALRAAGVPFEMHLFDDKAPHGVGLAGERPALKIWTDLCAAWLKSKTF